MSRHRWSAVSRHLVFGVLTEMVVVTLVLNAWTGLGPAWGLAAAVALIVWVRVVIALASFALAAWFRTPRDAPALAPARAAGLVVREVVAFLALLFVYHPFEALYNRHDPKEVPDRDGADRVLFVHGFFSNAGFWWRFRRFLERNGLHRLHTINLEPAFNDIEAYADQLAHRVLEICPDTSGHQQVVLVAHSMGGLVCRAYVRRYGSARVRKIITLGTPHHGTVLAYLVPGPNLRQMRPHNAWLAELNARAAPVSLVTYFSRHDNIIVPQDSARLPGCEQQRVSGLGHLSMAFSNATMAWVRDQILDKTRR